MLLADGGIHSNRKLAGTYFGSDQYLVRASDSNTGDGLQIGLAAGAATFSLDTFYAHLQHRDALTDERLWMRPSLDELCEASLVVASTEMELLDFVDMDVALEPQQFPFGMPSYFVDGHGYEGFVRGVRSAAGEVPVLSVLGRVTSIAQAGSTL